MNHITNIQLFEIFKYCKNTRFDKNPNFEEVRKQVFMKLDVPCSEKLMADIKVEFPEYKSTQVKYRSVANSSRKTDEYFCLLRHNYVKKQKRPLHDVSDWQQRRRLSDFVKATTAKAEEENISPRKLYAYGLKQKYLIEREVAQIGKSVFQNEEPPSSSHISLQVASAVFESGEMTKRIYTDSRLLLKGAGADVLPPYYKLDEFRKERRPEVKKLKEPCQGVKYDYVECWKTTTTQLLKAIELTNPHELNEIHFTLHDGLDGSGGHSIFNQKGSAETSNIIMYMFRVGNLKQPNGEVIGENPSHASSSSCRPIMLLMAKETRENCQIVADIQEERKNCQFVVQHFNKQINFKVNASLSMVDGKLHSTITGLGGAFCCLCTYSKKKCNDVDYISSSLKIDRSLE